MPLPVSSPRPHWLRGFLKVIDWRLVAAVGLPLWAFLTGVAVAHRPTPPAPAVEVAVAPPAIAPATPQAAEGAESIPAPREVVYRTEFEPVPVPVPTPGETITTVAPE